MHTISKGLFTCLIIGSLVNVTLVNAGSLSSFEKDVKSKPSHTPQKSCHSCGHRHGSSNHVDHIFFDLIGVVFEAVVFSAAEAMEHGGNSSMDRIDGNDTYNDGLSKRQEGDPLLPYFKLNLNTQYIDEDINGYDAKLEIGHGPLGLEVRATRYNEEPINDTLDFFQAQAYYRMSFGNHLGVNLGFGYGSMIGAEETDGFLLSTPFIFHNGRHLAFEYRPAWLFTNGSTITEDDVSLLLAFDRKALRLGYRKLSSPNFDISGPYIGIDFII